MRVYRRKIRNLVLLFSLSCYEFLLMTGCDPYESIMEDLSQKDASAAQVILHEYEIDALKEAHANKRNTTYHIKVKKSKSTNALQILSQNHIPMSVRPGLKEVFSSPPGLIPSKSDELARLTLAMQGESENLLKIIPGVIDARVVFSLDTPMDYKTTTPKKSASVVLIYQKQKDVLSSPLEDREVQNLVASSMAHLMPEDVKVVQKMLPSLVHEKKSSNVGRSVTNKTEISIVQWLLISMTILTFFLASYGILKLYRLRRV